MEWRSLGSAELKSVADRDQVKGQTQYMAHSLEIISYFSLLTQSYVYGWYINYLLEWSLLFLSPFHIIISVISLPLPGRYNCTRFTHFLCFSPVRRSSVEVHCIILIPSKEILWQSGEIQLGKGMDLYTEQLGAWKISPSFTTGLWLWTKYIGIAKLKNWRKPVSTITQELMKFENTLVFKNGLFLATLFWMILSYLESEIFPYAQVAVCNFTFLICVKTISLTTT